MFALPVFVRAMANVWRSPASRSLLLSTSLAIAGGTFFYHRVEELSWIDSAYLTIMTLTTVGYGDVSPHTRGGRLFTIFYVVLGIGLMAALITEIARAAIAEREAK